jgi:hypothetical protein
MFLIEVDFSFGVNMVHRSDCIHISPENNPEKQIGMIDANGGYLEFKNVGEAVRYLKNKKIAGLIHYCPYCKPTKQFKPEPAANLGIELSSSGCDICINDSQYMQQQKKNVDVTDTKTIFKRLSNKLLGQK